MWLIHVSGGNHIWTSQLQVKDKFTLLLKEFSVTSLEVVIKEYTETKTLCHPKGETWYFCVKDVYHWPQVLLMLSVTHWVNTRRIMLFVWLHEFNWIMGWKIQILDRKKINISRTLPNKYIAMQPNHKFYIQRDNQCVFKRPGWVPSF